jgi:hypothetical protein
MFEFGKEPIGRFADWLLISLDRVRAHHLIEAAIDAGREQLNKDDETTFTWLTLAELADADAVIATTLDVGPDTEAATTGWSGVRIRDASSCWRDYPDDTVALVIWRRDWTTGLAWREICFRADSETRALARYYAWRDR